MPVFRMSQLGANGVGNKGLPGQIKRALADMTCDLKQIEESTGVNFDVKLPFILVGSPHHHDICQNKPGEEATWSGLRSVISLLPPVTEIVSTQTQSTPGRPINEDRVSSPIIVDNMGCCHHTFLSR